MLKAITLRRLHNGEIIQFFTDALDFLSNDAIVANALAAQRTALANILRSLNDLYGNDPASALTDDLVAIDAERDRYLAGLNLYFRAFTYHPDAAMREAGKTLGRSMDIYSSDISRQNFNTETATIVHLLQDWATKPELVAAAKLLDISSWVPALTDANSSFTSLYNQRTTSTAAAEQPATMVQKRLEANTAWAALRKKFDANWEMADGAAPWSIVQGQLNTLINQYNATLDARAGRADARQEGE